MRFPILATIAMLSATPALAQKPTAPRVIENGPVIMISIDPSQSLSTIQIEDDWSGHIMISINDANFIVPGTWYSSVLYVDASTAPLGTTVDVVNNTWVPFFALGGAGMLDVACGYAGSTIYCGYGDTVVHGRNASLSFVVGHPKATTVTFHIEQSQSSVILEYVNNSRTRYKVVGVPTAKWER